MRSEIRTQADYLKAVENITEGAGREARKKPNSELGWPLVDYAEDALQR
jgi:hypothetical protein